jgi:hypothetical protein
MRRADRLSEPVAKLSEVAVALQGTLDTFALPDVLRLLAATKKTGRLQVTGNRGTGSVWVDAGLVVKTEASGARHATDTVQVLFEMLRYAEGSFTFDSGSTTEDGTTPNSVEPLLIDAEALLGEWRAIEAVIPSMEAWVSLVPELPGGDVVIDADRWRSIVAVGGGSTVWAIGDALNLGEVPLCRTLKELVELGLLSVGANPAAGSTSASYPRSSLRDGELAPSEHERTVSLIIDNAPSNGSGGHEPSLADSILIDSNSEHRGDTRSTLTYSDSRDESGADDRLAAGRAVLPPSVFADAAPEEADEVARQLASLSPQAARAVAAAAQASTDEEREAALAQVNDEEEPINRGLLLKFLSSVRS